MSPGEQLERLRDDDRWADRPFVARPRRTRPLVLSTAVAAAALLLGSPLLGPYVDAHPFGRVDALGSSGPSPSPAGGVDFQSRSGGLPSEHSILTLPTVVRAGSVVRYSVLLGPRDRVAFAYGCPIATVTFLELAGAVEAVDRTILDCPPHGEVADRWLRSNIRVPATLRGTARVRWSLDGGETSMATVTVRQ